MRRWKSFLIGGLLSSIVVIQCNSQQIQFPSIATPTKEVAKIQLTSPPIPSVTPSPTLVPIPTSIFDGKLPVDMTFVDTKPGNWAVYDPIQNSGLKLYDFLSITIGPDGVIWIGGDSGIAKFDGVHWESFFIPDELLPTDSFFFHKHSCC